MAFLGATAMAYSVQQTAEGGYVAAGYYSEDAYVVKLDSSGYMEWSKFLGGENSENTFSIQQCADGEYIVAGYTESYGNGGFDLWILKLDSSGATTWSKTYGDSNNDFAYAVRQTEDGGYVVAGTKTLTDSGDRDAWILKLDASGELVWDETYGGEEMEYARSIRQTLDGGYIVAGDSRSYGDGSQDFWILKIDSDGGAIWNKTFGGTGDDVAYSVQQTSDGGYVVVGRYDSNESNAVDFLVIRLDASGEKVWDKTFGGERADYGRDIIQTNDNGYAVVGHTLSYGAGYDDLWILKLDSAGETIWSKTYGGANTEYAYSLQQTSDGGYVVAGSSSSYGTYGMSVWILKLDSDGNCDGCFE